MDFRTGHQNQICLKDPEVRQKAFLSFLDHLSKGKSIQAWYYDEDNNLCCGETMQSYIQKNPHEFDPYKVKIAIAKGRNKWESVVEASAEGTNEKANTASLQMVMRNKYGWDAKDREENSYSPEEEEKANALISEMKQIRQALNKADTNISADTKS